MTKPVTWTLGAQAALARLEGRLFANTSEASAILDIDPRTLRRAIEDGSVPAVRTGANWRVPVSWLREKAQLSDSGPEAA